MLKKAWAIAIAVVIVQVVLGAGFGVELPNKLLVVEIFSISALMLWTYYRYILWRNARWRRAQHQQTSPTTKTNTCAQCGHENRAQAKVCGSCGRSLATNTCRNCNATNRSEAIFCRSCGFGLTLVPAI